MTEPTVYTGKDKQREVLKALLHDARQGGGGEIRSHVYVADGHKTYYVSLNGGESWYCVRRPTYRLCRWLESRRKP